MESIDDDIAFSDVLEKLFPVAITSMKITAYRLGYEECKKFVIKTKERLVKEHHAKKNQK